MQDIVFGLLAIAVGALLCFRGYLTLRLVIPIWGALAGFSLGAGAVASIAGETFLSSALGWVVGLIVGIAFALVAYLYYEVSVVIAMLGIGFVIGASVMIAIQPSWTWTAVLVGSLTGVALAALAVRVDLPMVLLVVLTAVGGATVMTTGFLLVIGVVNIDDFASRTQSGRGDGRWWWYALEVVLIIAGVVAQVRSAERLQLTMREAWEADRAGSSGPAVAS